METSENSPQLDLLQMESEASTLYAEALHVRILASQVPELDLRAPDPSSGSSTLGSLASYDHATQSWRTSQLCVDGALELFSETWPRSGMTRSGIAYKLQTWGRSISETESGSLLPTPTATTYGSTNNGQRPDGSTYRTARTPSLDTMARHNLWPTPTFMDSESAGGRGAIARGTRGPSLSRAVEMWPTPTAGDSKSSGRQR